MNSYQEADLKEKLVVIHALVNDKYRRGAQEHEGDLADMPILDLMDELTEELVDALIYQLEIIRKLKAFKELHK
jgi:hypothetical protein